MRNWGARLRTDCTLAGHRALVLEGPQLRVTLLPGRGGDVVEFLHKPTDTDFCTFNHRGLRRPEALSGLSFMDAYYGGWQEVFPSGGVPCHFGGAAFDQHAEVAVLPWDVEVLRDDADEVAVALEVQCLRTPLRLRRELRLTAAGASLAVRSTATSDSTRPQPLMWGQHLAFGPPAVGPGTRVELPQDARVVSHPGALPLERLCITPALGEPSTVAYLTGFREGRYRILPAGAPLALEVCWDASVLPYLWCWREAGGTTGFPWYGREYLVGFEPFSSYPTDGGLALAVANGSALVLQPGASRSVQWSVAVTPL